MRRCHSPTPTQPDKTVTDLKMSVPGYGVENLLVRKMEPEEVRSLARAIFQSRRVKHRLKLPGVFSTGLRNFYGRHKTALYGML